MRKTKVRQGFAWACGRLFGEVQLSEHFHNYGFAKASKRHQFQSSWWRNVSESLPRAVKRAWRWQSKIPRDFLSLTSLWWLCRCVTFKDLLREKYQRYLISTLSCIQLSHNRNVETIFWCWICVCSDVEFPRNLLINSQRFPLCALHPRALSPDAQRLVNRS